jgi:hypothetical protein
MNTPIVQESCITTSYKQYLINNQSNVEHNDYVLLTHGNGLMVACLAPTHFLTDTSKYEVTRVVHEVKAYTAKKKNRKNNTRHNTTITRIYYHDVNNTSVEQNVTFNSHMDAILIELNVGITENKSKLIQTNPLTYGYLCIFDANHMFKNSQLLDTQLITKCGLIVKNAFTPTTTINNQMEQ